MIEATGRTIICSVVFIDIVRYSETFISQQAVWKESLNGAIGAAVQDLAEKDRVILDTGDGSAICFLGDPEDALFAATAINRAIGDAGGPTLRTGINLGPIKLVVDLNGRTNVVGDGINVAQRIMSFAEEGEILVSRSYYEVVVRLTEGNERLFRYMGTKRDKHIREHQLYAFSLHREAAAELATTLPPEDEVPDRAGGAAVAAVARLAPDFVAAAERRLAGHVGPLAKVMVARAAARARSAAEFGDTLAALIQDPADRASFLASLLVPADAPEVGPAVVSAPEAAAPASAFDPQDLVAIERHLARHIGPLARIMVQRAARAAGNRTDLAQALAAHIPSHDARRAFLAAIGAG